MGIELILNGKPLTDVVGLKMNLTIEANLQGSHVQTLAISVERKVGEVANAEADQLTFATVRGKDDKASVQPVSAALKLTSAGGEVIGGWESKETAVEDYWLSSESQYGEACQLVEKSVFRADKVSYKMAKGNEVILDTTEVR